MAKKKNIYTPRKQDLRKKLGMSNASKKAQGDAVSCTEHDKQDGVFHDMDYDNIDEDKFNEYISELEDISSIIIQDEESLLCPNNTISIIDELPQYGGKSLIGEERKHHIDKIIETWHTMNGVNDLCVLLNLAWQVLYGMDAVKTTNGRLKLLAREGHYVTFKIPKKKKDKFRTIDAPCNELKNVQQALNFALQVVYRPHLSAMGFVKEKSVVTNARVHLCQNFVYNIDLKDFFPSIKSGRVFKRLMSKPFCLNEEVASLISDLCCYKKDGSKVLPQGAPTSPIITNIICERLDDKLNRLAKAYGLKYTRYADDITFSGMNNVFAENGKFYNSMRNIIENEEHFMINPDKTRLCHKGMRQEVTGLTVNAKTNVSRKYTKQIRTLIHNWEIKGYDVAQAIFAKHYAETNIRNLRFKGEHHIENVISGKLMYLKMVKGETDPSYKSLYRRFEKLYFNKTGIAFNKTNSKLKKSNETEMILSELNNLVTLIATNTSE